VVIGDENFGYGLVGRALMPNTVQMRSVKSQWMGDIVSTERQGKMFKGLRSPRDDCSLPCGDVRPAPAGPMTKAHAEIGISLRFFGCHALLTSS